MPNAVDWVDNPGPAGQLRRLLVAVLIVIAVGNVGILAWNPSVWVYLVPSSLFGYILLAFVLLATLSEVPTRVAVDGPALRVRYLAGEKRVPLSEVVAADLAPGPRRGLSVLRLAQRRDRIFAVRLETPAAENVASRLERIGILVNRRPPPRVTPSR